MLGTRAFSRLCCPWLRARPLVDYTPFGSLSLCMGLSLTYSRARLGAYVVSAACSPSKHGSSLRVTSRYTPRHSSMARLAFPPTGTEALSWLCSRLLHDRGPPSVATPCPAVVRVPSRLFPGTRVRHVLRNFPPPPARPAVSAPPGALPPAALPAHSGTLCRPEKNCKATFLVTFGCADFSNRLFVSCHIGQIWGIPLSSWVTGE